ncbi:MAG TPA: zinc-dependent metalloprotease [Terriglobales bacterium]|nr:zinc-dependent metalloprotease [Terriglobales bacterium]
MKRATLALATLLCAALAASAQAPAFIPFQWNQRTGVLAFTLTPERLAQQFLRFTGLDAGVGSLSGGGDRGTVGPSALCRFERVGNKVLVVQLNTRFRATNGSAELQHSVADSFPEAVLAALPILSENNGTLVVNANPLVLADTTGMARQLRAPLPGIPPSPGASRPAPAAWRLDPARSGFVASHSHAFPRNTETEALLTFVADNGRASTAIAPGIITVRVHQSFVELPPAGFSPREADPRVGYFTQTFEDFSQPYNQPLVRHLIERWRLQKKDPSAALSDPVQPLTFYLDQAIPEPLRSAIRRGVLWWNQAFLQAGITNALVVKDLPLGADPNDFRYPTIQWTHREGRGWSVGQAQADPRTGEILHAVLQLDSHRGRTVHNYWDALLPTSGASLAAGVRDAGLDSFAAFDGMDPQISQQQSMVDRIALLACHEMGHVLGLQHNFLASTYNRGSVMDYFAPRVKIRPDGTVDLSDAYMQGVGSYDKAAIQWGYGPRAQAPAVVKQMIATGIIWGSSQDARWSSYDDGPDPVAWLQQVVPVRDALLQQYGARMLRPGQPASVLANRFALVYLFHQYGLLSALNVIGGAKIPPSLVGDGQTPVTVWPEPGQRLALRLELQALAPKELAVSPTLWKLLAPLESQDQVERTERFRSSSGYLFDAFDGPRAITDIVVNGLLDPARLERLETIRQESLGGHDLSATDVINALLHQAFPTPATSNPLQGVVQTEAAEGLMDLAANPNAPPNVQSAAWAGVAALQRDLRAAAAAQPTNDVVIRLQGETARFVRNPRQFAPRRLPTPAPAGPPVGGGL